MVIKEAKNNIFSFLVSDQINKEKLVFVMKKIDSMFQSRDTSLNNKHLKTLKKNIHKLQHCLDCPYLLIFLIIIIKIPIQSQEQKGV